MESEKIPDSDSDWQAIDIFVFSNGQQYSPPRKYHLQAEDISLWKSTLSFLAKTQYGPFHATIDLYTTEGRKVGDPLQLSNGGSYVAVQPQDHFIEAGYDKYLIKASRSWERRKAKRNEGSLESDDPKTLPNMGNIDENVEYLNIEPLEDHVILKSRISSIANHDASTIIKPQLLSASQRRSDALFASKQTDRKKTSIQSPLVVRKITPSSLPVPNIKNSYSKKKENMKSAVKIFKPEERRPPSSPGNFGSNAASRPSPRLGKAIRPPSKSKDLPIRSEAVLPKVQDAGGGIKTSSSIKVTNRKNDEKLSTSSADLKNVIEDKEFVLVSNLYQNPYMDMPSISANPITMQSILYEPERQEATTTIVENINLKPERTVHKVNSDIKISIAENNDKMNNREVIESISINHNVTTTNPQESILIEKLKGEKGEQYPNRAMKNNEGNINELNNDVQLNDPNIYDNIKTQDSLPIRRSIKVELPDNQNKAYYIAKKLAENLNNGTTVATCRSTETIKVYNSSPPRSSTISSSRVLDSQYITHKIEETRDGRPAVIDKSLNDQYKATLKKGDVVNFKLNIEIENYDGALTKHKENMNCHTVTIIRTDKGSQSNIDDQIIAQNKSLLSLITKEFNELNIGDNHRVIIIQYNSCKYCNEYNAANPDRETNKNYVILLPTEKFEEIRERCHCNDTRPELEVPNLINPVKPSYSCTSLERITKPLELPADIATQNIRTTSDMKSIENVVMVSRKKSVAINEESTLNTREPSKIIQEVEIKTQLITVSVESIGVVRNITMVNNSTQTEWCDVLLEARLLCDGHYTFHLPPLELLKYYKLT